MSGGHFDYVQYRMDDTVEKLRRVIEASNYPDNIEQSLLETAAIMEEASARIREADYLICHDHSEESYMKAIAQLTDKLDRQ